jgi:Lycopene cyclase
MLPGYHYSYLVGAGIFWVAWVVCAFLGRAYRSEMRWGTLIAAPMALTSLLFVPEYWNPPSLFNLDAKVRVGIEDFLWAAAVGGIAAVVGEILLKEHLRTLRSSRHRRRYGPFVLAAAAFLALRFPLHWKTMPSTIVALALCALALAVLRPNLIKLMLVSAASFTILYFVLFLIVLALYPDFVKCFYTLQNLLGIYVCGVPIEELLFAASGGAVWSIAYEYVHGYRLERSGQI